MTCRMYSSLAQLVRGWSRIFYDALDRRAWRLASIYSMAYPLSNGHVALLAGLALWLCGPRPLGNWLIGLSLVHHAWMYLVFRRVYRMSAPEFAACLLVSRWATSLST